MSGIPPIGPPIDPHIDFDTLYNMDWTEFPNEWDRAYMEWREELEEFALQLREAVESRPIPLADYEDGKLEAKWDGELHPVSKEFYAVLLKVGYGKDDDAPKTLVQLLIERSMTMRAIAVRKAKKR